MEVKNNLGHLNSYFFPEDWKIKPLNEVSSEISDGIHTTPKYSKNTDFYFINGNNLLKKNIIITNDTLCVNYDEFQKHKRNLSDKTILISINGTIGNLAYFKNENVVLGKSAAYINLNNCVEKNFLYYVLSSEGVNNYFENESTSTTIRNLSLFSLRNTPIPLPPLPEQRAIAEVLSDVDHLITSLDALIEKKQAIKDGVMQELLSCSKRIPGCKGKWIKKRLGEIGTISGSGVDKKIKDNETPVRLLNYMDVYNSNFITSKEISQYVTSPIEKIKKCSIYRGDIFFTPSSEVPYDIANSAVAIEDILDAVYSYHLVRLRLFENVDWDLYFRSYIFKTRFFLDQAEKLCAGSGQRYVISLKAFQSLEVYYPEEKSEQREISNVIFDLDEEM
ncbi:MAG: hypothetical protein FJZ98_03875, partial [Chloroflexi bacterium]|nr:hypothetical protein [Chloroflexota bacterium]